MKNYSSNGGLGIWDMPVGEERNERGDDGGGVEWNGRSGAVFTCWSLGRTPALGEPPPLLTRDEEEEI